MKTLFAWFLLAGAAIAQITVPAENEPYKIIEATVKSHVPEGATLDGGWKIPDGIDHRVVNSNMLYLVGPPGEYILRFDGFWIHLKQVTFTDGAGNPITITSYLGHGMVNEEAMFKITGGDPGPDPPNPGPNPGQKYQLMFFLQADELDKMPPAQRELATSLSIRKDLAERGHRFLMVVDDDQITGDAPEKYRPWIKAVEGDPLPRIAMAPIEGGKIIDLPMPRDYQELMELLGG